MSPQRPSCAQDSMLTAAMVLVRLDHDSRGRVGSVAVDGGSCAEQLLCSIVPSLRQWLCGSLSLHSPGSRSGSSAASHSAGLSEGASVWACLKRVPSRSRSEDVSNPKPPHWPKELTGALQDCGCPDAQAQARWLVALHNRAWESSADLGRSVPQSRASTPLNSPSPFYPPHKNHTLVPGYNVNTHCVTSVHVPGRQLGRDRIPWTELSEW